MGPITQLRSLMPKFRLALLSPILIVAHTRILFLPTTVCTLISCSSTDGIRTKHSRTLAHLLGEALGRQAV